MSARIPAEVFPPGEFIRGELSKRGWTQNDLSYIMDRPLSVISLLVTGKRKITAKTAVGLSGAFGTSAEFWMNLESTYRLSMVAKPPNKQANKPKYESTCEHGVHYGGIDCVACHPEKAENMAWLLAPESESDATQSRN